MANRLSNILQITVSSLREEIWTSRFLLPTPPEEPCPVDPILTRATISFITSIDDKNRDTYLIVELKTVRGEPDDAIWSNFDDQSECGPYHLLVNGPWFTKSRINSLRISIHPNGDDTWWFSFKLDMTFSNGERISFSQNAQRLSEEHTEEVYTPLF